MDRAKTPLTSVEVYQNSDGFEVRVRGTDISATGDTVADALEALAPKVRSTKERAQEIVDTLPERGENSALLRT